MEQIRPTVSKESSAPRAANFPSKLAPMLATQIERPFSDPDWFFEPKLDGFRGIAFIKDDVKIQSRRGYDLTRSFRAIAESFKGIGHQAVLDGEMVALTADGKPCFECLQRQIGMRMEGVRHLPKMAYELVYYVFDVLYLDGYDLMSVPLSERKKILSGVISKGDHHQLVDYFENAGELVFEKAVAQGFEGAVAKRRDSFYEPGMRSDKWLKAKTSITEQFLIGGYVLSERTHSIGGLVVGRLEDGKLKYRGGVGAALPRAQKDELALRLASLEMAVSPFDEDIFVEGEPTWVRPELTATVKFTYWTRSGYMREPVLVRIQD